MFAVVIKGDRQELDIGGVFSWRSAVGEKEPIYRWIPATTFQEEGKPIRPFSEIRNQKSDAWQVVRIGS